MNLIYLRAIAKLPIVIMGETGCGKTSLIEFFVQNVLQERLEIINIHAGITSTFLASRVEEIITWAHQLRIRLWVFFDEFNTSECVGQICEMLCERTFQGNALPKNIVLLAACNPYRLKPLQLKANNVGIQKSARYKTLNSLNLVHAVKPLPEAVIEYMWDFGALTENDSEKYVRAMLKQMNCEKNESLFVKLVCESQKYFQELEDISSVSLRDVARFVILYQWFEVSLRTRKQMRNSESFLLNCKKYELEQSWSVLEDEQFSGGVLALCSCYYYRLKEKTQRQAYLERMCIHSSGQLNVSTIEKMLQVNENDFIARMELPDGTALNQALRENISCLLPCIFCKIALFICGKPGCSKSLAVQFVFSNLRGQNTIDAYFRTLPELIIISFQGSESSTSEGILKVFKRAKIFLSQARKNILPVVVFDEIGLAELSKDNPLKVLHSLLELKENRSVGFIGISNWRLDSSKMNRAMYLARPDPDCQQLILTARSIFLGYKQQYFDSQIELVEKLAVAYIEYKEELRETRDAEFFGLRDFYGLVKKASFLLLKDSVTDPKQMFQIVKYSVERNFGGKIGAASSIMQIIIRHKPELDRFAFLQSTPTITLINDNLKDDKARFLMLICKGNVTTCAVEQYLELQQKDRRTLVGSHMPEDENEEDYTFHSLSDIILYMEAGIPIILKNMTHVYTSLYDLFNQNFAVSGNRRYCRVALGAQFNPRCFVHHNFRAIVFLSDDDDVLEQTDAPFLNRFEKHRFDVDQIFTQRQIQSFHQISDWAESLLTLANDTKPQISLSHVFPLYSPEYLKLLVLCHDSKEDSLKQCKHELLRMASQEVMLLAHSGVMESEEKAFIQESWNSFHCESFLSYLSSFALPSHPGPDKSLIFLYNIDVIRSNQIPENTDYQHFSSFHKEEDITEALTNFYRGSNVLYLLDFDLSKNGMHLEMVKFVIEKISKEVGGTQKKVCLLVRLKRNEPVKIEVCWFNQWEVRTYTNYLEPDIVLSDEVLKQSVGYLIKQNSFYDFASGIEKLTLDAYQTIAFTSENREEINNYIFAITEQIRCHPQLIDALCTKLLSLLPKKRWIYEVLCRSECTALAFNIPSAIRVIIELELAAVYPKVLFAIEKFNTFGSFFIESQEKEFMQSLWLEVFEKMKCEERLQILKQSNRLNFASPLPFPFVKKEYAMLNDVIEKCQLLSANQAKSHFLKQSAENSILKQRFEYVNQSLAVQDMYFRSLIIIDLLGEKKELDVHEEEMLALLHKCWGCGHTFQSKVWIYFKQRKFSLALCGLTTVLRDLLLEEVELINSGLSAFLNKHSGVEENEEVIEVESDVKSMLIDAFKQVIGMITGNTKWLQRKMCLQKTAVLLNQLFVSINCLDSAYDFFLESYDEIDILALCFQALSPSPSAHSALLELQQSAAAVTTGPFLYNENFSHKLLTIIKKNCSEENAARVLSVYLYKLLIYDGEGYLPMIIPYISSTEGQLWKHSSSLVSEISRMAGLINDEMSIIVEISQSSFVEKLEQLLAEGEKNTFPVLLCDSVYRYMKKILSFENDTDAGKIVSEYYESFKKFFRIVTDRHAYPSVIKIYSSAFLRRYLEAYCKVMHNELPLPLNPCIKKVAEYLNSNLFPTARAYVLKYWRQSEGLSPSKLHHIITNRSDIPWARHLQFDQQTEAIPCKQIPIYLRVSDLVTQITAEEVDQNLNILIDEVKTIDDSIAFATALMMKPYLRLAKGEKNDTLLHKLELSIDLMNRKFGNAMSQLILCMVNNFPEGSCLRLTVNTSEEDKNRALSLCFALITLLSNVKTSSPLTSLFLSRDGNVRSDILAVTNRSFVCGVGSHPLYSHLQHVYDNFEVLKSSSFMPSYSKGSANKCSCGYVYIIDNCGGPMEIKLCPFCTKEIGGKNHQFVQRLGHENMTDQNAMKFMKEELAKYKLAPETGYWSFDGGESTAFQLRGMTSVAHGTMHLLIVLLLRFLNLSSLIPDRDLQELVHSLIPLQQPSVHLEEQLSKDFSNIKRLLNIEDSHLWWYALLKQLALFMQTYDNIPSDLSNRARVESQWNILIEQFCKSPMSVVQSEKALSVKTISLETSNESDPQAFPLVHFYRLVREPEVVSLEREMELRQLGEQYPLLSMCLHMKEDIAKLSLLSPLIKLTNHLKNCFDHRIRREEARKIPMAEVFVSHPDTKELFENCKGVWSWLSTCSIAYECHTFDTKKFTSEEELLYFLIDKQENGGGTYMTAALQSLGDIQNRIMNGYLAIMENKMKLERNQIINTRPIPIQGLQQENIVQMSFMKTLEVSFVNNPEVEKGREIVYDFLKIEERIQSNLEKGRLLTSENMEFICYTFEMLSISSQHSSLITNIREMVPQQPLTPSHVAELKQSLESDLKHKKLTTYYESLNTILYFLQNTKVKAEMTLMEFAMTIHKCSVCDDFMGGTNLSQVQVNQIVALYELVECWLFPYSKEFVKPEFNTNTSEVGDFLTSLDFSLTRPIGELQLAVMRLVLRLLIADIDPLQEIGLYITRPDLWAEDCPEQQVEIFKKSLRKLTLAHAMQLYNFLEKRVQESLSVPASLQLPSSTNPSPIKRPRNRGRE